MCPKCNSTKTGVYNSRKNGKHGGSVWRRRHCEKCFHNWSTVEISQDSYDELTNKSKLLETLRSLEKTASNIIGKIKGILPDDGITSHVHANSDDDHWDIIQHIHSKKPYKLYNLPIMWPTNSEE